MTAGAGWLYSTRNLPHDDPLSTRWGVLYAAEQQREVVFSPPEDSASSGPCLLGAAPLLDGSGQIAGFLLIRLEQSDLNDLLGGAVGTATICCCSEPHWPARLLLPVRPVRLHGQHSAPAPAVRTAPEQPVRGVHLHGLPPPLHRALHGPGTAPDVYPGHYGPAVHGQRLLAPWPVWRSPS